ncbi:MAG: zinc ribbon domain-containing protein [Phycisphaerae bacterium]|jgi:putative FmdB family regulatory protein
MPLYGFKCKQGHVSEDLYSIREEAPKQILCPRCHQPAFRQLSAPKAIGATWSRLDQANDALLSDRMRKRGIELKGQKDIEAYERSLGVHRTTAEEAKLTREKLKDEDADFAHTSASYGTDAAWQQRQDRDVMDASGLNSFEYANFKNANEAVSRPEVLDAIPEPD